VNTNAYFALGKSHTVCQDYAESRLEGVDPIQVMAAVSDGCSSSPDTDFGSRFMARAAMVAGVHGTPTAIWNRAKASAQSLMLMPESLDATLLTARVLGDRLWLSAYGDGVIAVQFKDGSRQTWSISFPGDAPAYMNYLYNERRLKAYLNQYGVRVVDCRITDPKANPVSWAEERQVTESEYSWATDMPMADIQSVTICSDGVRSFRRTTPTGATESVPLQDVLDQIMAIKSSAGEFVVRRMRRFLYDFCPKNGWVHDDDVAVATILNGV